MTALLLAPPVLALLLLAAHFYRGAQDALVVACVVLAVLACVPRRWAVRGVQIALVAGAVVWVQTLVAVADVRQAAGQPWQRMALILGGVALFTVASALVFFAPRLKRRLDRSPPA